MLKKVDPEVYRILQKEIDKQRRMLNLIASENYVSKEVLGVVGCLFTNKYAEGYPGDRCYGGCQNVDSVEALAIERACRLFGAEHANVQPHAGSQANMGVYFASIKPGDKILAMSLRSGGHLTHGKSVNFSGILYQTSFYNVNRDTETIDYDEVRDLARKEQPNIICCGASSYSRVIDFEKFGAIAREVNAYLMADIAHIAGLVVGGVHPSPVPHAQFVSTTTHKTLRGPRGGMILCRKEFADRVDRAIFPGIQGGPLVHVIAGKAVALKEAMTDGFRLYQQRIVANAARLAGELTARGYRLVSGGTDNHLMSIDLRGAGITGADAEALLGRVGIIVNHNTIPYDPLPPKVTSGIRLGTPAVTTRGLAEDDMARLAGWIDRALKNRDNDALLKEIGLEVRRFAYDFPFYAPVEEAS